MSQVFHGDDKLPLPRPVVFEIACDGACSEGLFGRARAVFNLFPADGAPESWKNGWTQACAAGWLVTPELDLCPSCRRLSRALKTSNL